MYYTYTSLWYLLYFMLISIFLNIISMLLLHTLCILLTIPTLPDKPANFIGAVHNHLYFLQLI
jgi:hypothetical protein